jgi:hypothetical protein
VAGIAEGLRRTRSRPTRAAWALMVSAAVIGGVLVGVAIQWTLAAFTAQQPLPNQLGAAQIFRDERVTPAFAVGDRSSGALVDRSSGLAFAGDGLYLASRPLTTDFAADRYVEFDMNSPLPAGLSVSGAELNVRFSADTGGATACYYVELRRAADGSLLSTHGSSGSPLDCVTGTTFAASTVSLAAASTTGVANDLRVRVYARDSAGGPARVDLLTVSGSTPHASFTLYPLLSRDVNGSDIQLIPWELSVP